MKDRYTGQCIFYKQKMHIKQEIKTKNIINLGYTTSWPRVSGLQSYVVVPIYE